MPSESEINKAAGPKSFAETNPTDAPEVKSGIFSRPFTLDRVVRMLITLAAIVAAVWVINLLKDVLLPFCVAWLVAYMLEPFVQYNKKLLGFKKRLMPVFLTLLEFILILILIGILLVPSIVEEVNHLSALIQNYATTNREIAFIPEAVHEFIKKNIDFAAISKHLTAQNLQDYVNMLGGVISGGYDLVMGIFNWFLVLLYIVFIMLDYDRLLKGVKRMVPPKYRGITYRVGTDIKNSMNHYFRGQALVAFCVGVLFSIGFAIIGMPLAVVLGMFIGLLNMVPYLQLISIIPTTLLCLVVSSDGNAGFWTFWLEAMAVYCIVQCIQDLFLTPKIMGKAMGLNPALILLSLSVWGTLLGFIGLIIALPLTTLLLAYYELYIIKREDDETPPEKRENDKVFREIIRDPGEEG